MAIRFKRFLCFEDRGAALFDLFVFLCQTPLPLEKYDCEQCGACCKGHLLVEVYDLDVTREPRLATADVGTWTRHMTMETLMAELEQEGKCLVVASAYDGPCKFLAADNRCEIYPTRPNICVAMPVGDEQCQDARKAENLPPLQPVTEARVTTRRDEC